jgi:hypothetical protein
MLMSTWKLIIFRVINITLCRFPTFAKLFKEILVNLLIKGKGKRYVASSKFFSPEELE